MQRERIFLETLDSLHLIEILNMQALRKLFERGWEIGYDIGFEEGILENVDEETTGGQV